MMAIISLASALTIVVLLVKLSGKLGKFFGFMFKSIKKNIVRATRKKKLPTFITIFSFFTVFFKAAATQRPPQEGPYQQRLPQQGFPQQGFPQQVPQEFHHHGFPQQGLPPLTPSVGNTPSTVQTGTAARTETKTTTVNTVPDV